MLKQVLAAILLFLSVTIYGQSSENSDSYKIISHNPHHSHLALFLGGTTFYKNNESHFSLGADYVYRPNPEKPWAYSIFTEVIFADHTEYLIGLPVYYYIEQNWWLRAGPGMEIIQEEEHHGHEVETKTHIELLFRIGSGYEFHFGDFSIIPSIDLDLVRNNDALVWGLNLGYSF